MPHHSKAIDCVVGVIVCSLQLHKRRTRWKSRVCHPETNSGVALSQLQSPLAQAATGRSVVSRLSCHDGEGSTSFESWFHIRQKKILRSFMTFPLHAGPTYSFKTIRSKNM